MVVHGTGSMPSANGHVVHAQPIVSVQTQLPGGGGSGHFALRPLPSPLRGPSITGECGLDWQAASTSNIDRKRMAAPSAFLAPHARTYFRGHSVRVPTKSGGTATRVS
jgi:hypothetical protein